MEYDYLFMPKGKPRKDGSGRGVGNVGRGGCKKPEGKRKGLNRRAFSLASSLLEKILGLDSEPQLFFNQDSPAINQGYKRVPREKRSNAYFMV